MRQIGEILSRIDDFDFSEKFPNLKIRVSGELPNYREGSWLDRPILELVVNCAEEGAGIIDITFRPGYLRIEDDVRRSDVEISFLLKRLNTEFPETSKVNGVGMGIFQARSFLTLKEQGALVYTAENNRIIATMTWKNNS